jgi:predicted Rossmann fold flavoprotein
MLYLKIENSLAMMQGQQRKNMKIIILGGGAAGFFAAIHNKKKHPKSQVMLIEKSNELLAKVKISGGGRCNVTNACFDPKLLTQHYPRGHKELLGPFHTFQPSDTMAWFKQHGVALKTEADNRVFPLSNDSQTIVDCLIKTATEMGITIVTNTTVTHIVKENEMFELSIEKEPLKRCHKLILATGSGRRGHTFAESFGHKIIAPIPSLFTFKIDDRPLHGLSGLAVATTEAWISGQKKQAQKGPLLITHWGMSGPVIIRLSAWQAKTLHESNYQTSLFVNWLPEISGDMIRERMLSMQAMHPKKGITTQSPFSEIPQRLWEYLVHKVKLGKNPGQDTWQNLYPKHIETLAQELAQSTYRVTGKGAFKDEFVTCGGVDLKEINFKTMESKLCPGLHIIGELLNIDGITGGFNFQNAWTTGFLSAE